MTAYDFQIVESLLVRSTQISRVRLFTAVFAAQVSLQVTNVEGNAALIIGRFDFENATSKPTTKAKAHVMKPEAQKNGAIFKGSMLCMPLDTSRTILRPVNTGAVHLHSRLVEKSLFCLEAF